MVTELIFFIAGFASAILWDKYRDWIKFKQNCIWIYEELEFINNSLQNQLESLPDSIQTKILNTEAGQPVELENSDLEQLKVFSFKQPYNISAWRSFVYAGLVTYLNQNDYKTIKQAYDEIETANYLMQTSQLLLASTSSPLMNQAMISGIRQLIQTNNITPIMNIRPKIENALHLLKPMENVSLHILLRAYVSNIIKYIQDSLYISGK